MVAQAKKVWFAMLRNALALHVATTRDGQTAMEQIQRTKEQYALPY